MAVNVRRASTALHSTRCGAPAHASFQRLHLVRGLIGAAAAADYGLRTDSGDNNALINWNHGGGGPVEATVDWDYNHLSEEEVASNWDDAITFRLIVQRLPGATPNVKELRAFRDNVTRKLAPTVARALASSLSLRASALQTLIADKGVEVEAHVMAYIDGHAVSRLAPQPLVLLKSTSAEGPAAAHSNSSNVWEPQAHLEAASIFWLSHRSGRVGGSMGAELGAEQHIVPATDNNGSHAAEPSAKVGITGPVLESHSRRRRRGTGRGSLAQAGRHGLPQSEPVAVAGRQLPAGW